jgi:amidase
MATADSAPSFPLSEPNYANKRARDFSAFADALAAFPVARARIFDLVLADAAIPALQRLIDAGELTSTELVTFYVDRIRRYDLDKLNAVLELNPNALADAAAADELRAAGTQLDPMHGIPVLLKDNIATGDGLHATAGAYALKDWRPDRDAFLVQQLRKAGAIILGKTNLSEWANYMDPSMPNGFSTLGGQTRNPCGPFDPLGSSSGSAVAAAANFAAVTVGSETQGSIISPARANAIVGLKPSHGLVSGDYVIPLVDWMDVVGPMGRNVTDVAILLTAMTGVEEDRASDPALTARQALDYAQFATAGAAVGLTVAIPIFDDAAVAVQLASLAEQEGEIDDARRTRVVRELTERTVQVRELAQILSRAGLKTVEVSASKLPARAPVREILQYGFQDSFNRFALETGGDFPVKALADVVTINEADMANRAPYGHGHLRSSVETKISGETYAATKAAARSGSAAGLRAVLAAVGADLILAGDLTTGITYEYASAGFPAITLPIGYGEGGEPHSLVLTGDYLAEPQLIAAAYAVEQVVPGRRAPDLGAIAESFVGLRSATAGVV